VTAWDFDPETGEYRRTLLAERWEQPQGWFNPLIARYADGTVGAGWDSLPSVHAGGHGPPPNVPGLVGGLSCCVTCPRDRYGRRCTTGDALDALAALPAADLPRGGRVPVGHRGRASTSPPRGASGKQAQPPAVAEKRNRVTPRIVPKTPEYQAHLEEQARRREQTAAAAREYAEGHGELLQRFNAMHGLPVSARDRSAYGPDSKHSWFRDQALDALERARQGDAITRGVPVRGVLSQELGHPIHGDLEDARRRLATVTEQRVVTTADPGGASFLPAGSVPGFLVDAFATGARAEAMLATAFGTVPLPPAGVKIESARIQSDATTAVQTAENTAVSSTDLDTDKNTSNVAYVAGMQDVVQQLVDRAAGGVFDQQLAMELGADLGSNSTFRSSLEITHPARRKAWTRGAES
jgi:hypothetical protein